MSLSYVLPLRWTDIDPASIREMTAYLRQVRTHAEVVLVDGSPAAVFAAHHETWGALARPLPPDPAYRYANGMVNGVPPGALAARHEHVVIADDDVRYTL